MKNSSAIMIFILIYAALVNAQYEHEPKNQSESTYGEEGKDPAERQRAENVTFPFKLYTEYSATDNYYCLTGKMGDYSDSITMDMKYSKGTHSGNTCIEVIYDPQGPNRWAGLYWLEPDGNWGTKKGGYDLTGARKLTFWAKGEKGKEIVEFKMGGIPGAFKDTAEATLGKVRLSKEWKKFIIDLKGLDLSRINGGFAWIVTQWDNVEGCKFYIDDVMYE